MIQQLNNPYFHLQIQSELMSNNRSSGVPIIYNDAAKIISHMFGYVFLDNWEINSTELLLNKEIFISINIALKMFNVQDKAIGFPNNKVNIEELSYILQSNPIFLNCYYITIFEKYINNS